MKKKRLFREEIKDRHTNHWDLDMMSREELEAVMAGKKAKTTQPSEKPVEERDAEDPD